MYAAGNYLSRLVNTELLQRGLVLAAVALVFGVTLMLVAGQLFVHCTGTMESCSTVETGVNSLRNAWWPRGAMTACPTMVRSSSVYGLLFLFTEE